MVIKRTQLSDPATARFQDDAVNAIRDLSLIEITQGDFYEVAIGTSSARVYHSLGRIPKGYIVVKRDSASTVYHMEINKTYIDFMGSVAVNATLYIF